MQPEIVAYYQRGGERDRLAAGDGRLEFLRTRDVLARVLPGPPASVLDVGGATGVYAAPLAAEGYRVHVVDPLPEHAEASGRCPGVTASVGDARCLAAADASVDAVLLLGPLYHLTAGAERVRVWREAARVVRPGGVVVAATISRFASMLGGFVQGFLAEPAFVDIVRSDLASGVHRNPDHRLDWFTTAYFAHPEEPPVEASAAGLAVERVVAVEGPLWMTGRLDEVLADPARTATMLELLRQVEAEPSLLGASAHLLTVARRPSA
ncbi:MAG: methyltransferase domain-containing protein [Micromonosporaceae bacterium]